MDKKCMTNLGSMRDKLFLGAIGPTYTWNSRLNNQNLTGCKSKSRMHVNGLKNMEINLASLKSVSLCY